MTSLILLLHGDVVTQINPLNFWFIDFQPQNSSPDDRVAVTDGFSEITHRKLKVCVVPWLALKYKLKRIEASIPSGTTKNVLALEFHV